MGIDSVTLVFHCKSVLVRERTGAYNAKASKTSFRSAGLSQAGTFVSPHACVGFRPLCFAPPLSGNWKWCVFLSTAKNLLYVLGQCKIKATTRLRVNVRLMLEAEGWWRGKRIAHLGCPIVAPLSRIRREGGKGVMRFGGRCLSSPKSVCES